MGSTSTISAVDGLVSAFFKLADEYRPLLGVAESVPETFAAQAARRGIKEKILYTLGEASEVTGVPYQTLLDECKAGRLMHHRSGKTYRVRADWVDRWIREGTRDAS